MNKLRANTAFGRSRPHVPSTKFVEAIIVPSRPFHISTVHVAGEDGSAVRPPSRRLLQNQIYSQQVQNLAQSVNQGSSTTFRSLKLDRNEAPSGTFDARHLASQPKGSGDIIRRPSTSFRGGQGSSTRGGFRGGGFQSDRRSPEGRPSDRGSARRGRGSRRSRGDGEPGRRGQAQRREAAGELGGGAEDDAEYDYEADEAMAESFLKCEDEWEPPSKPHSFQGVDKATLVGNGPSLALGEWGMCEIVEEKLDQVTSDGLITGEFRPQVLAQRVVNGEWVRFRDDEERDSVAGLAKSMAEQNAILQSEQKGEVVEPFDTTFQPLSPEQTEKMTKQLLMGVYDKNGLPATLKDIALRVRRSGTVTQPQEDSLIKKVRSMLPVQRAPRPVRASLSS
ncbi:hypothetical protein MMC18_000273 [Xylographa bjoerkii]|nr:hypothetical protein [Xylographa bjoerkii]